MSTAWPLDLARQNALAELRLIVDAEDVLYKPAQFLLAAAGLDVGDASGAETLFIGLMRPVEERADQLLERIEKDPSTVRLRGSAVWKAIPPLKRLLQPHLNLYADVLCAIYGGPLQVCMESWWRLRDELDAPVEREAALQIPGMEELEEELGEARQVVRTTMIESMVATLSQYPILQGYAEIAAGMKDEPPGMTREQARKIIDKVLSEDDLDNFRHCLSMLEVQLAFRGVIGEPGDAALPGDFSELSGLPLAKLFNLEPLKVAWESRQWEKASRLVAQFAQQVQERGDPKAKLLLLMRAEPTRFAWWIRLFVPAYSLVPRWRAIFRDNLYLEAAYGRHLAEYHSSDSDKLTQAHDGAVRLEELLRGGAGSLLGKSRAQELHTLTLCLICDAGNRVALSREEAWADSFLLRTDHDERMPKRVAQLEARSKRSASKEERAAIARSLGLSARALAATARSPRRRMRSFGPALAEMEYFERAREEEESAETYFCLAESWEQGGHAETAKGFLVRALRLAPYHARARALAARIGLSAGE